jgi:hypothetical protein
MCFCFVELVEWGHSMMVVGGYCRHVKEQGV